MRFQILFSYFLLLLLILACNSKIPDPFKNTLGKLEGEWMEEPGIGYREVWQREGNNMAGTGFMHAGGTFSQVEELVIAIYDSTLIYQATVTDQNAGRQIDFPLLNYTDTSLVFVNPYHDFPNIIGYYFLNDTLLRVQIKSLLDDDAGFELTLKKSRSPLKGSGR